MSVSTTSVLDVIFQHTKHKISIGVSRSLDETETLFHLRSVF